MPQVLVIGSSNTDLVVQSPTLPAPGETILGGTFFSAAGGKGANQAVAAARAGANVIFIACVGQDDYGQQAIHNINTEGINTQWLIQDAQHPSGVALIIVDKNGENSIVVASGANAVLTPDRISMEAFHDADICLLQLETPIETVLHAATQASSHNTQVVLNPAPATDLPQEIWQHLFLITPNETETEILTGVCPDTDTTIKRAADALLNKGAQNAIITLGEQGAFLATPDYSQHLPAYPTQAIDTTGAGDTFNGTLCCALSEKYTLIEAVQFASAAAALSVAKAGAQPSIPTRNQIEQIYNK